MPFGQGPRNCIGQYFALLEARLVMGLLWTVRLSRFPGSALLSMLPQWHVAGSAAVRCTNGFVCGCWHSHVREDSDEPWDCKLWHIVARSTRCTEVLGARLGADPSEDHKNIGNSGGALTCVCGTEIQLSPARASPSPQSGRHTHRYSKRPVHDGDLSAVANKQTPHYRHEPTILFPLLSCRPCC